MHVRTVMAIVMSLACVLSTRTAGYDPQSTAFWDAYLRADAAAKAWLAGDGPRQILQPKDRWQTK